MAGRALRQKRMRGILAAGVRRISCLCLLVLTALSLPAQPRQPLSRFERAVRCVKYFEGWHGRGRYPYIGYGHRLLKGERFTASMTERQADSLLRADLLSRYALFRRFGKDALLLTVLSYRHGHTARWQKSSQKPADTETRTGRQKHPARIPLFLSL